MAAILNKNFFNRSANSVAHELVGCNLCLRKGRKIVRHTIYETEAYMGPHDLACHASKGRTKRTEVMYQKAGTIYVYLIYGMYFMLNIVTGEKDFPAAVLIRGVGAFDGPGKLTKALSIGMKFNALSLGKSTGMWIERPSGVAIDKRRIYTTPRIGVAYANEWAKKKLRFVLKSSKELHI